MKNDCKNLAGMQCSYCMEVFEEFIGEDCFIDKYKHKIETSSNYEIITFMLFIRRISMCNHLFNFVLNNMFPERARLLKDLDKYSHSYELQRSRIELCVDCRAESTVCTLNDFIKELHVANAGGLGVVSHGSKSVKEYIYNWITFSYNLASDDVGTYNYYMKEAVKYAYPEYEPLISKYLLLK